jgi:transposase
MKPLRREARRLIARDPKLYHHFRLMLTVPGIAETSALQILGELLYSRNVACCQWVAFSGLERSQLPSRHFGGKTSRMSRGGSRHLRRAL